MISNHLNLVEQHRPKPISAAERKALRKMADSL